MKHFVGICKGGPDDGKHLEHYAKSKPVVLNFNGRYIHAKYEHDGHGTWRFVSDVLTMQAYR